MWLTTGTVGATALVIAQQSSDPTTSFAQLGIASIVCALLFSAVWTLWRDNRSLRADIATLQTAQVLRERELGDRVVPLLVTAVDLLGTVPGQFDRALNEAARATGQSDLDRVMRRMEEVTNKLSDERGGEPRR